MAASAVPGPKAEPRVVNRWLHMCAGIIAMMAIAHPQYARALFTNPFTTNFYVQLAVVQVALAALMVAETWLAPIEGYSPIGSDLVSMITLRNRSRIGPKEGRGMSNESVTIEQKDIAREAVRQVRRKPVDPVGVRRRRDDRHLQLPVCLHAIYARHETELSGSSLRENSRDFFSFHPV